MKRIIAVLTSCLTLISYTSGIIPYTEKPMVSIAESQMFEDWEYEVVDGSVTLIKYNGDPDYTTQFNIELPTEINGLRVTNIDVDAFSNKRQSWCRLTIPENSDCILPDGLLKNREIGQIYYGDFEFRYYSASSGDYLSVGSWLKKVTQQSYPPGILEEVTTSPLSADTRAVKDTTTTTAAWTEEVPSVTQTAAMTSAAPATISPQVPTTTAPAVQNIEMYDVTVPGNVCGYPVKEIESDVFSSAVNLGKLTLPDSITSIRRIFLNNSSVTEVNIPKNVSFIPDYCFQNTPRLQKVTFHDDIIVVSKTAFQNSAFKLPEEYYDENAAAAQYSGRKTVGDWIIYFYKNSDTVTAAFWQYIGSAEVLVIPSEVDGIKITAKSIQNILSGNETVKEILFDEDVNYFPKISSSVLEKITLPNSVEKIDFLVNCTALKSIVLPPSVREFSGIGGCSALEELVILSDEINISGMPFYQTSLTRLDLPGTCNISATRFPDTLRTITFREGDHVEIGKEALKNSKVSDISFSSDIKKISVQSSGMRYTPIERLELSAEKTYIAEHAFRNCEKLKEVVIDGDVTIGAYAFADCPSLEKVAFKGNANIADYAFENCSELTEIIFDTSTKIFGRCFNSCPKLMYINGVEAVSEESTEFAPELKDYIMNNFQTAHELGFMDRFTINSAKKIVSEVTDEDMSEIEKVKALHDWVCTNTTYDFDNEQDLADHVDSSIFLDGVAVCEGFAKTYNLLLHEAGIETCYVHNGDHAWNVVKVGGKWFHIDTTWDGGDPCGYTWFLRTDDFLIEQGGPHAQWSIGVPSKLHSFQQEELPSCTTKTYNITSSEELTSEDAELIRANVIKQQYAVEYDYNLDGRTNAADIASVYSKVAGSSMLIGDVNNDGKVDSSDASEVLAEYSKLSVGREGTFSYNEQIKADIKADGKIDSSDASMILGYYSFTATGGVSDIAAYLRYAS